MAVVKGWARRLGAVQPFTTDIVLGVHYDDRLRPETLSLLLSRRGGVDTTVPLKLEARFSPDEARQLGDAVVNFLTKLEG